MPDLNAYKAPLEAQKQRNKEEMQGFNAAEIAAVKQLVEAKKRSGKQIIIVNGKPFDLSKVRAPLVSEDAKHTMYANPRLMLKTQKPSYEEDPENGVEYEWLLRGSYERLSRKKEYRPVLIEEVDFNSKFCKLDANVKPTTNIETGEQLSIVASGEFELFETRGEAAYLLKRYGSDQALSELKARKQKDFNSAMSESGLPLRGSQFVEDPAWEPGSVGNLGDPGTWGGRGGKFV